MVNKLTRNEKDRFGANDVSFFPSSLFGGSTSFTGVLLFD